MDRGPCQECQALHLRTVHPMARFSSPPLALLRGHCPTTAALGVTAKSCIAATLLGNDLT